MLPPPPPTQGQPSAHLQLEQSSDDTGEKAAPSSKPAAKEGQWETVAVLGGEPPCQRSLHSAAVWNGNLYIFGGYSGSQRCNDLHCYNFASQRWSLEGAGDSSVVVAMGDVDGNRPSPRDRHISCVWGSGLYVFGGFDGLTRVNDLYRYDLELRRWTCIPAAGSHVPSPRHSHAAVVYGDSMYVFGGYDGSYRCDFHQFDFRAQEWSLVRGNGKAPKARYRGTCVVRDNELVLHGGHDGNKHLQDTHIFSFASHTWSEVPTLGSMPKPRDSHVSVVHRNCMYILGGSTGQPMSDFHRLDLDTFEWSPVLCRNDANAPVGAAAASVATGGEGGDEEAEVTAAVASAGAGSRFCHVGVMQAGSLWVFGGYDGQNRLNDFQKFQFLDVDDSTLIADLKGFVNSELLSDITFIVEGRRVYAHKLLCLRCPYFYNMLTGEYMESRASELVVEDVRHEIFVLFLEFLYSDEVEVTLRVAMELFQAADRFSVDRLKAKCEHVMLSAIGVDSAAQILLAADQHNAEMLRERCIVFMLTHFDQVSVTAGFEEMSRANLDLNLEIIRRRFQRGTVN